MQTDATFRRRGGNSLLAICPPRFIVIASRVASPDRLEIVLRGDYDGTLAGAGRHAFTLANSVAERFGVPACADVHDASSGIPLLSVSTAGGAA